MTDLHLADICDRLQRNSIFAMSLGSKEHSNLLGWYVQRFLPVAVDLADSWSSPGRTERLRVAREQKQLDLVIEVPGFAPVVIENKMFALPDEAQLDRYAQDHLAAVGTDATLVLLSLTDPGWADGTWNSGDRVWTWRRYGDLRDLLLGAEPRVRVFDPYAADTLLRWCALIEDLGALADLVGQPGPDEPLMLDQTPGRPWQRCGWTDLSRRCAASTSPVRFDGVSRSKWRAGLVSPPGSPTALASSRAPSRCATVESRSAGNFRASSSVSSWSYAQRECPVAPSITGTGARRSHERAVRGSTSRCCERSLASKRKRDQRRPVPVLGSTSTTRTSFTATYPAPASPSGRSLMQESHIAKLSPPTGDGERDLRPRGFADVKGSAGSGLETHSRRLRDATGRRVRSRVACART